MDQERWNLSQILGQLTRSTDTSNGKPTSPSSTDNKFSRYQYDMKQAAAMRASSRRCVKSVPKEFTADDVVLGLNGLDKAIQYKQNNQDEMSLKLYQMSLELLIKILSSPTQIALPFGLSRSVIESRVNEALSEAEQIKLILDQKTDGDSPNSISKINSRYSVSGTRCSTLQSLNSNDVSPKSTNSMNTRRCDGVKKGSTKLQPSRSVGHLKPATSCIVPDSKSDMDQTILRDFFVPSASLEKTTWNDIAGLQHVKQALQEAAILPLIRPDLFTGLRKPRNVLLYGPPGTGKTMLVKAVAHESQSSLFIVTSSALTSKWLGEAEKLVRSLFTVANKSSPSIVFIDEIDALLSSRKSDGEHEASRRLKTEFMIQIDGMIQTQDAVSDSTRNVLLLACTNCPWDIDSAIIRRFPRRIYIPLPDSESRKSLLNNILKKQIGNHSITGSQVSSIVRRTEGYSCSDITSVASEAAFGPIRSMSVTALRSTRQNDMRPVEMRDFDQALQTVQRSVTVEQLKKYDEWHKEQAAV